MKTSRSISLILSIAISLLGCKEDEPTPTDQELVSEILTSADHWQSPVVTVDGVDHSDLYKDFQIKFNNDTYASTAGSPLWKSSGTWKFNNEEATIMKLDDTQEVEIRILPDDLIELSLQWNEDTFTPGRVTSVKGKQKFRLKKNK